MSSPDEQAALAQQRGLLGNEQQQATGQILGALPGGARTNVADLMKNLAGSQASERGALDLQAVMESLNRHRQALMQSAQVYGSVGPKGGGHQSNLPELVGNYAYQQAMQKAMKVRQQQQPGANDPRFQPGGSIWAGGPQIGGPGGFPGMPAPAAPVAAQSQPGSGLLGAFGGAIGGLMGGGGQQPNVPPSFFTGANRPPGPAPLQPAGVNGPFAPGYNISQFTQQPGGDMLGKQLRRRAGG